MALDPTRLKNTIKANIEAVLDFPQQGRMANFIDDRVLQALCDGIVSEIQGHADVIPASHLGENLSAPAGQPVTTSDQQGGTNTGTVTSDTVLVGMGSIQ